MMPIAQAIGESNLTLLELVPRRGVSLEIGEKVYIGEGKRDKIYYILGRLHKEKLTESAKSQLQEFIRKVVKEREQRFVEFFNKSEAINKRIHQIELLPGFGKKHMQEILKQRKEKLFENFGDMKARIAENTGREEIRRETCKNTFRRHRRTHEIICRIDKNKGCFMGDGKCNLS